MRSRVPGLFIIVLLGLVITTACRQSACGSKKADIATQKGQTGTVAPTLQATELSQTLSGGTPATVSESIVGTPLAHTDTPTAPVSGKILFEDSLKDGWLNWYESCDLRHADGGLKLGTRSECTYMIPKAGSLKGHTRIEVTRLPQNPDSLPAYGLIFGAPSGGKTRYRFSVPFAKNYLISGYDGSGWTDYSKVFSPNAKVSSDSEHLAIEIEGPLVKVFVNDVQVASRRMFGMVVGEIGFYVGGAVGDLKSVGLRDVRVTELASTELSRTIVESDLVKGKAFSPFSDSTCSAGYVADGFQIENLSKTDSCHLSFIPLAGHGDVRIESSVRLALGNPQKSYGIVFGRTDEKDRFYLFLLAGEGKYSLYQVADSGSGRADRFHPLIPWNFSSLVRTNTGARNRIAVEVRNRQIRCYVNDSFVGEATAPRIVRGFAGLFVEGTGMRVVYSDFKISELELPQSTRPSPGGAIPGPVNPPPQPIPPPPASFPPVDPCMRIVGDWQWYTNTIQGVLGFGSDHRVSASAFRGGPAVLWGSWTCDAATSGYVINWQNNVVERVTMAEDGQSVTGTNNFNMFIRGYPLR